MTKPLPSGVDITKFADPLWRIQNLYSIINDDGRQIRFTPNDEQLDFYRNLHHRNLILKARQLGFCVAPTTRVLTADLRWVPIKDLQPGQEIIATDEHVPGGRGSARKMRTAKVEKVGRLLAMGYRIKFDDGREVVCTDQHPWLTRKAATDAKWRSISGVGNQVVGKLTVGTQVRWITKPWEEPTVEDGWFGGMLDGEGSISKSNSSAGINVSQREGPVWDRLCKYATDRGYNACIESDQAERLSKYGKVPVPKLAFGRMDEMLRLIGQTRPTRFLGCKFWEGRELPGKRNGGVGWATVVSIEEIGPCEMIDLQTSTKTYIAEGFVSHNTTFIAILLLDQCIFNPNFTAGIIAHTKDDAGKIFRNKVAKVYEALPQFVRNFAPLSNQTADSLIFENGSSLYVSASVRSGTVQFLHVSEMGKIARKYPEKAREIVTGSFEAVPKHGIIVVESTAEGKTGWFYTACMEALRRKQLGDRLTQLDFKLHFYPWFTKASYQIEATHSIFTDTQRDYFKRLELMLGRRFSTEQRAWYTAKQRTLGDDMKREYPSTPEEAFEGSMEGLIYAKEMAALRLLGRIGNVPVRAGIKVNTFWDLGLNDHNSIWLQQRVGAMNRFPKFMQGQNEGMRFYYKELEAWRAANSIEWGKHYLPHDGDQRIQGYEVITRKQILEDLGFRNVEIVPRIPVLLDGIDSVRRILPECEFDEAGCAEGIECLDNYSREWDEHLERWSSAPRHDQYSDGADAFRQFAQSNKDDVESPIPRGVQQTYARGAY